LGMIVCNHLWVRVLQPCEGPLPGDAYLPSVPERVSGDCCRVWPENP
jgi:hypothetical protein